MTKHSLNMPRNRDINEATNDELQTQLSDLRMSYMSDKGDTSRGGNPPGGRMRQTRITIARILTVMRNRGITPRKVGYDLHENPDAVRGIPVGPSGKGQTPG